MMVSMSQQALEIPTSDGRLSDRQQDMASHRQNGFEPEPGGWRDHEHDPADRRQELAHRRQELAGFLRSRRERIAPEQVGLPPASRRRTPGLRREEVATLAGVGVTWYTWLEQGRDINASPQVLDAVSRTLLLDPHEREHLFRLVVVAKASTEGDCTAVPPTVALLLDKLEPWPATVRNARYDCLAFNRGYERLVGGLAEVPFEERNTLWRAFMNPGCR